MHISVILRYLPHICPLIGSSMFVTCCAHDNQVTVKVLCCMSEPVFEQLFPVNGEGEIRKYEYCDARLGRLFCHTGL